MLITVAISKYFKSFFSIIMGCYHIAIFLVKWHFYPENISFYFDYPFASPIFFFTIFDIVFEIEPKKSSRDWYLIIVDYPKTVNIPICLTFPKNGFFDTLYGQNYPRPPTTKVWIFTVMYNNSTVSKTLSIIEFLSWFPPQKKANCSLVIYK